MIIEQWEHKFMSKAQQEQVQKQQQEFKLIGTFHRSTGLTLFEYDHKTDLISKVEYKIEKEPWMYKYPHIEKAYCVIKCISEAIIDTNKTQFESLNMKNAQRRVDRWKSGHIDYLNNLQKPKTGKIKFY